MRCRCKRRKSPSFANFVMFVSRKKAVGSGKNSISAGCRGARERGFARRSLKYLHPIVTLERRDALCVKELYRHSWNFNQCLKYRSSLIHKKNDSSPLRVEYSMQQTCWERGGFWYILQTVSCSLSTFPNKKIYSYLLHMCTLPQIFSEHLSHSL